MILCGGEGTRLREFTEVLPKPLVEIGGRPILWHIMNIFSAAGVNDFTLCLGYKGNMIRNYFLNYEAMESDFTIRLGDPSSLQLHNRCDVTRDWKVTCVDTGEQAMTGARIARAARFLVDDERFCLTYGDGIADIDINELIKFHVAEGALATMTGIRPPSRFGDLEITNNRVTSFREKSQVGQGLINGGFMVMELDFLRYLTADDQCVLEREPLERCARDGQLAVYEHHGFWYCMDTFRDWKVLDEMWRTKDTPWLKREAA